MSALAEKVIASFEALPSAEKQAVATEILRRSLPDIIEGVELASDRFRRAHGSVSAERFRKLAIIWKEATAFLSDIDDICSHPAYQEIIGMGSLALPYILRELEQEPDNWFWALKAITGEDPVPEAHRGDMARMADDWLNWARRDRASVVG